MPETAFLGAQIAPKSLSAWDLPQTPLGGAYSAPPDTLAGIKGPTPKAPTPKGRGGSGGEDPEKLCTPKNSLE